MRIVLVQPPQGTRFGFTDILTGEPLGLEAVGAGVRARGHEAELVDLRLDDWEALGRALDTPAAVVGVSCAFTTDVYSTLEVAGFAKERRPTSRVIVGGHHASLVPADFGFANSPVDAVVVGEGETTAADLLDAIARGSPLGSVPGVYATAPEERGGFRPRVPTQLDRLPAPDRSLSARYRSRYHHGLTPRSASLETSRGCPFDCSFCSIWIVNDRRVSRRSPAGVLEQLRSLMEDHVFFTDDVAFLRADTYRELGERIKAEGVRKSYACETRSDLVVRHAGLFSEWKRIGLDTTFLGVEKVDDAGLDSVRKRTRGGSGTNLEAIRILRDLDIRPMTSFIVDPAWDEAQFDRLEAYIETLRLPAPTFTILTPLPGTPLFRERHHELTTLDYGYYDVLHAVLPTRLPLERFYARMARLYDHALADTRPSWAMLRRACILACSGNFWCLHKVHRAVSELRVARSYLEPPVRTRRPAR